MIKDYLEKFGWEFTEVEENLLVTSFLDEKEQVYPLLITIQDQVVSFTYEYQLKPGAMTNRQQLLILALRYNYVWPFVKIGLNDEQDALVLSLDFFEGVVLYSQFEELLGIFVESVLLCSDSFQEIHREPTNSGE